MARPLPRAREHDRRRRGRGRGHRADVPQGELSAARLERRRQSRRRDHCGRGPGRVSAELEPAQRVGQRGRRSASACSARSRSRWNASRAIRRRPAPGACGRAASWRRIALDLAPRTHGSDQRSGPADGRRQRRRRRRHPAPAPGRAPALDHARAVPSEGRRSPDGERSCRPMHRRDARPRRGRRSRRRPSVGLGLVRGDRHGRIVAVDVSTPAHRARQRCRRRSAGDEPQVGRRKT